MGENVPKFPRFFRITTTARSCRNKMKLPAPFLDVYEDELDRNVKFVMGHGIEKSVIYRREKKKFYGIGGLFKGDSCTIFNYMGTGMFQLYVFSNKFKDRNNACTGFASYGPDYNTYIGWKFVSVCLDASACDRGLVLVPPGHLIPTELKFTLPNGQTFTASYSIGDRLIHGLRIFHINDVLMLTYVAEGEFDVVLFDHCGGEKTFSPYAARVGAMVGISWGQFKIEVQPFHLYKYCYGIDILADYRACTDRWSSSQYLTISHGSNVFFLQLRKCGRRWKINAGWVRFSKLLRLSVGDVLVFDMTAPPLGFSVCVYRIQDRY